MDELQEEHRMATSSNSVISVIANADTVDLPPSDPNLSSTHSSEDTNDLEELEAEAMRLRFENERVEWKWRLKSGNWEKLSLLYL